MPVIINFLDNSSLIKDLNNIYSIYNRKTYNRVNYIDLNNAHFLNSKIDAWTVLSASFTQFKNTLDTLIQQNITPYTIFYSRRDYVYAEINNGGQKEQLVIHLEQQSKNQVIQSDAQSSDTTALGYSGDIGINGHFITVSATDNLTDISNEINSASAGVTSAVNNLKLRLSENDSGTANQISLQDPNNILQGLGLLTKDTFGNNQIKNPVQSAQDSKLTINGVQYGSATNTIDYNGLKISILQSGSHNLVLNVESDVSDAVNSIKYFVKKFNDFIEQINGHLMPNDALYDDRALKIIRKKINSILNHKFDDVPDYRNQLNDIGISQNTDGIIKFTEVSLDIINTYEKTVEKTIPQAINMTVNDIRSLDQTGITQNDNGTLSINLELLKDSLANHFADVQTMLFNTDTGILPSLKKLSENALNGSSGSTSIMPKTYAGYITNLSSNKYKTTISQYTELDAQLQDQKTISTLLNFI